MITATKPSIDKLTKSIDKHRSQEAKRGSNNVDSKSSIADLFSSRGSGTVLHPKLAAKSTRVSTRTADSLVDDDEDGEGEQDFWSWLYEKIFGSVASQSETEFSVMMKKIAKDPDSLRTRMWKLLELHHSST
jgi:hypothetical protein